MQYLIYYLATGSNTLFNFINSKGEIQAVEELERKGFRAAIMDAMKACVQKSREMSKSK